jgi:small subunit ribosomal protein S7
MSRKERVYPKRRVPDSKYSNELVAMLINYIMKNGKKTIAQKVVYGAFDLIKAKTKKEPIEIFDLALRNVQPVLEVRAKRIGGANYQIPIEVPVKRRNILALRWLLGAAKSRKGKPMGERLALEILDASQRQGGAVKKREDVHKMAEANRAFAHYA